MREGSPHQRAPGAQYDYWFPVCCPGRRLRSNIMVILGWIGPESERKKVLVAKPTKFSR